MKLARDDRTACTWQSFITDEDAMRAAFGAVMTKLLLTGQDMSQLVDCSELIPGKFPFTIYWSFIRYI